MSRLFLIALLAAAGVARAQELGKALTFHASFDRGTDADFALGDGRIHTAPTYKVQAEAKPGLDHADVSIVEGKGRWGAALEFRQKNTKAIFYQGEKNVAWRNPNWNGTVSFWLSLDPDQDLAPGFCDPIQVTDKAYNDAALWVDFTRDERPRHFRLGVFGDLKAWNPQNLPGDKNPDFAKRLIAVTKPPFARGQWTHVVITHSGLNTDAGVARLYLNGKLQGTSEGIREPFTWNLTLAAIRVGVNYVGLFDDLSLFDRALSEKEVQALYQLKTGASELRKAARR